MACQLSVGRIASETSILHRARFEWEALVKGTHGNWQCVFSLELSPIIPPAQTRAQFKDPVPRTQ